MTDQNELWTKTRETLIRINPDFVKLPERWEWRIDLREANLGGADLGGAYLRGAYLREADLREADLGGADLRGAYLRGADLREADLRGADLGGAYLGGADLGGADLGGAYLRGVERIPSPELARQMLAIIETEPSRLQMDQWHTCETTHCGWGWAIVLNGETGTELESKLGTPAAGAILFPEFSPYVFVDNETAIEKLKEIAAN